MEKEELLPDVKNIKTQETYTLPSKGLVYAPDENMPASITLRRMTTKEDKIRLRNQSEDRIRRDLLQACIVEDIDAGKLKLMDANFLLFRLRSLSLLDDMYKVAVRCPHCGTEFVHQVNLSEVPIEFIKEDDLANLKLTLPICKSEILLKFPSIDDIIHLSDRLGEYFNNFPNADRGEIIYTAGMSVYVDSINGNKLLAEELDSYIDKMDIIDNRELSSVISKLDNIYGFTKDLVAKCPSCKKDVQHGLPITAELFTPSK